MREAAECTGVWFASKTHPERQGSAYRSPDRAYECFNDWHLRVAVLCPRVTRFQTKWRCIIPRWADAPADTHAVVMQTALHTATPSHTLPIKNHSGSILPRFVAISIQTLFLFAVAGFPLLHAAVPLLRHALAHIHGYKQHHTGPGCGHGMAGRVDWMGFERGEPPCMLG